MRVLSKAVSCTHTYYPGMLVAVRYFGVFQIGRLEKISLNSDKVDPAKITFEALVDGQTSSFIYEDCIPLYVFKGEYETTGYEDEIYFKIGNQQVFTVGQQVLLHQGSLVAATGHTQKGSRGIVAGIGDGWLEVAKEIIDSEFNNTTVLLEVEPRETSPAPLGQRIWGVGEPPLSLS